MPAPCRRSSVVVALALIGVLAFTAGPAPAHDPPGHKGHKCAKKKQHAKRHKCKQRNGGGPVLGTPDNPQIGDLFQVREDTLTIGTTPTRLVALTNASDPRSPSSSAPR